MPRLPFNPKSRIWQRPFAVVCALLVCGSLVVFAVRTAKPPQLISRAGPLPTNNLPPRLLGLRQAITENLTIAQQHTYQFTGLPGHLFRCTLQPDEYGVSYALHDHANQLLRQGQTRSFGATTISFITPTSGTYTLTVSPPEELESRVRYEINLLETRPANSTDAIHLSAELAMEGAARLSNQQTAAYQRQAINKYKEAELGWNTLGNRREQGFALLGRGVIHYYLSEEKEALDCFTKALATWQLLNELAGQAETSFELANVHTDSGNTTQAEQEYRRALALWQSLDWKSRQPPIMTSLAVNQIQQGRLQEAIGLYQQARQIYSQQKKIRGETMTTNGLGNAYFELGEYREALDQSQRALMLAQQSGSLNQQYIAHLRIGEASLATGETKQVHGHLRQALQLGRQLGDPRREALAIRRLGEANESLGDQALALGYYQCALPITRRVNNLYEEATLLLLIGQQYERQRSHQLALSHYADALKLSRATQNQTSEIASLHHLAHLDCDLGDLPQAQQHIERALHLIETLRERVANRQLRESYFATVQKSYGLYIDILMRQHERQPHAGFAAQAWQANEQARARTLREMLNENRVELRAGLPPNLLEKERALQEQLNAKANRLFNGTNPEELEALARAVRDLRLQLAELESAMRQAAPGYAALTQPPPLSLRAVQQKLLDERTALLEYALGEAHSYVWLVTPRQMRSWQLPKRSEIEPQARRVYELLTARLQLPNEAFGERARNADAQYWQEAKKLSEQILPPVLLAQLKQPSLLVVSDGALQYLPFAALPLPGAANETPLLTRYEVTSLPSIAVLAELRRQQAARPMRAKTLAVLADPVYNANDVRLRSATANPAGRTLAATQSSPVPNARQLRAEDGSPLNLERLFNADEEAEALRKFAAPEQSLILKGLEVNRGVLDNQQLTAYRILHFALHGYLSSEHPELSGLFLSCFQADGKPADGLLRMHEIYRLKLPAELIVLSACETALGKEVRGEGLLALTRGFMYAGATRVVASLWKVDDNTTPGLMGRFYAGMLRERRAPAAALRQAQLEMLNNPRTRAPFYWAAFILQGEPRNFSFPSAHPTRR